MVISKALGTYNMKDVVIQLTESVLIVENTTAFPKYQVRIVVPFDSISNIQKRGNLLTIVQKNNRTIKISFFKRNKIEFFYNYLSRVDTNLSHDTEKCAFCGATLQGEYCVMCGQQRVEIEQESGQQQIHRCWSCGAEFERKVNFCGECGAKQDVNKMLVRIGGEIAKKSLTTVCPKCHSRNIKIYRKGYNYKVGFWGAIFGVKGAGYAGGFDANTACCRCMDCGKDWETNYDYRLIDK